MAKRERESGITRRGFLVAGTASFASLSLGLRCLGQKDEATPGAIPATAPPPAYGDWRDVYRDRWRWDRIARGTHTSANCVAACAWNLYVRDGMVWREEQSAPYVASNDSVPDWNPRGCQKGACYGDLATGPSRVAHPLKRVGARGSGQWKRISWDDALAEIATAMLDALERRGGEGVICNQGGHLDFGPTMVSAMRFFRQMGVPVTDSTAMVGDLAVGGTITFGEPYAGGSSDDWFRSKYIVLWGFNPAVTRIPDAHFLNEARYHGARVVAIAPDYNQSAIHTDLWMSVRPGSDAALALAACRVILEENLYDAEYIAEQSDLPFLIRVDTGRFLRESDGVEGGKENVFAIWNELEDGLVWAPGCEGSLDQTIALPEGVRPALDLRREIELPSGERVEVRTVFSLLREKLAGFSLEQAAESTGVPVSVLQRFAREFAGADAALILSQYGMCKNYHSDLIQRSQILLASLTGNPGKAGGGWRSLAFVALDGMALVAMQDQLDIPSLVWLGVQSYMDPKEVMSRFMNIFVSSSLFHAVHGGIGDVQLAAAYGDPELPEGAGPYLAEALAKGHFPIGPPPDADPPEVIVSICGNVLRHSRMGNRVRDHLFEKAKLVVDITFRMSETGRHSDILLPAAGWYEKLGLKYIPALTPYVTLGDRAVPPLGESKPEWEIFSLLAEKVGAEAKQRGISEVRGFRGDTCSIADIAERFSDDGRYGPGDEEKVVEFILGASSQTRGYTLEDLREKGGALRLKALGQDNGAGIRSEYSEHEPVVPHRDSFEKKKPYPTLTGRQQFYIDHPWFMKLGEELPVYKAPPAAGGDHPFTMTGGHTRWSIHAIWRDHALMLRLQRGEPVLFLNDEDADAKGIADHDVVRVWNDLGSCEARAKLTGAIRKNQVHIYHAWEPYQFRSKESHQSMCASPIKITQLVGDYGQLHWSYGHYEPNQTDRDTRVDIALA